MFLFIIRKSKGIKMKYLKTFEKHNLIKGGKADELSVEEIAKKFSLPKSKIED